MTKGTYSQGKMAKRMLHIRCRRCGHPSYHKVQKRCSRCGYGATSKLRFYNWMKKKPVSRKSV